jgi:hypothetical protein
MSRGIYKSVLEMEEYQEAEKDWHVELSFSNMHWFDLIVAPNEIIDTRKAIVDYLKFLKDEVKKNLEKRFIYFICSRIKVRFNTNIEPQYDQLTGDLKLHLLIGKNKEDTKVQTSLNFYHDRQIVKPKIELSEKFITFIVENGDKHIMSVHDFLSAFEIEIKQPTTIQYIGYTKNPDTRPTSGAHGGLNEILYKVSNEENDILIFFNLFKVMSNTTHKKSMMNFTVPNSMTDEINVDLEGAIIEKCFILYFDSNNQSKNKAKERGELRNTLAQLSTENKINSIVFYYEFERPNEYWKFCSSSVSPSYKHLFTAALDGDRPLITKGYAI